MFKHMNIRKRMQTGFLCVLILALGFPQTVIAGNYISTNRDTRTSPEEMKYDTEKPLGYELLHETENTAFYWKEERDILAVYDKRNGYTWKSGADIGTPSQIKSAVKGAKTPEDKNAVAEPLEANLNSSYTAIANSMITVEYYESTSVKYASSAAEEGVTSKLEAVEADGTMWRLDVEFMSLDLQIKVYISLEDGTIKYYIPYEEVTGKGKLLIKSIWLTPFLGASGGMASYWDEEAQAYGEDIPKYMVPGYVLVPDGSGSLIRFQDNETSLVEYVGDVYGDDLGGNPYYNIRYDDALSFKEPAMPVFGIAHGNQQAAFVAWAESGAEYMEVVVRPEENKRILYTWAYPRFEYNTEYFQMYNKKGEGFFTMKEEPSHVDVSMTYCFLSGDGKETPAADYTGMAQTYRQHLIQTGVLEEKLQNEGNIPIRLDFIMGDSKKGLVGTEQVVVTKASDVNEMLEAVIENGITNINSGLIGWQKKGETLTSPGKIKFTNAIGSEKSFRKLIQNMEAVGVDISYSREFSTINLKMMNYYNTAVKHISNWYINIFKGNILPENTIVEDFSYAIPEKQAQWVKKLADRAKKYSSSLTVDGMSHILVSNHGRDGVLTSLTDTISLYDQTFEEVAEELKLNMVKPNSYLWKYTDRYLQMPVNSTQYIFETDTVPFLQMVLHGTMEMYAPYANFSFYTQPDILRMIDYNVYPSFILSKQPSWYLADTNSFDMYSTEFTEYEPLIYKIYAEVNEILSETQSASWTDRTVLSEGVVLNGYNKNSEHFSVLINYTENSVTYEGIEVPALSAQIIR